MSGFSGPSAEAQIAFLQRIQRLVDDGEFQATYKFALLLAIAELAVECGDDSGAPLDLGMARIAEKFAELYWRQMAPYGSGQRGTDPAVLVQNRGRQVELITHLLPFHEASGGRFSLARELPGWKATVQAIGRLIRRMPLYRLQVIEGVPQPFLYEHGDPRGFVRLNAGVAFNLRRYQALIQQLARARWVEHIRSNRANAPMLGSRDDLESFMFGSPRAGLAEAGAILAEIQSHRCFYCGAKVSGAGEADHFVPWSRYPRDTAHNFVFAHRACNNDKRALLAASRHVAHWLEHIDRRGEDIGGRLGELGFTADRSGSVRVAAWAYRRGVRLDSPGWIARGATEPLGAECIALFEGGRSEA